MNRLLSQHRPVWLVAAMLLAGSSTAIAATPSTAGQRHAEREATLRYQQERARCIELKPTEERATCLREATAALAEARRGALDDRQVDHARNARMRCQALPQAEQAGCLAMVDGQGTVSGSVEGGGIYRELIRRDGSEGSVPLSGTRATGGAGTTAPIRPAPAGAGSAPPP